MIAPSLVLFIARGRYCLCRKTLANKLISITLQDVIIEALIVQATPTEALIDLSEATSGDWFFAGSDDLLGQMEAYGDFADPKDGDMYI